MNLQITGKEHFTKTTGYLVVPSLDVRVLSSPLEVHVRRVSSFPVCLPSATGRASQVPTCGVFQRGRAPSGYERREGETV